MPKPLTALLLFACLGTASAQQLMSFSYDNAGNQTARYFDITPPTSALADEEVEEEADDPFLEEMGITATAFTHHPNPVTDYLHLQWEAREDAFPMSATVVNNLGQVVGQYDFPQNSNTASLNFSGYAQGLYTLLVRYSDGAHRTVKIIKQ